MRKKRAPRGRNKVLRNQVFSYTNPPPAARLALVFCLHYLGYSADTGVPSAFSLSTYLTDLTQLPWLQLPPRQDATNCWCKQLQFDAPWFPMKQRRKALKILAKLLAIFLFL